MRTGAGIAGACMRALAHAGMWTPDARAVHRVAAAVIVLAWAHGHMGTRAVAQSTGTLRILCEPAGSCEYLLDGRHRKKDRELSLMEGPHRFVFWAPERRVLDTTLMVMPNALREARIQLRYSEEFIAYNRKLRRFQRDDRWLRYGTPVLAAGAGAWFGVSLWRTVDAQRAVDDLAEAYRTSASPAGIAELKRTDIPEANRELRQARTMAFVSGGALALSGAALWYVRSVRSKRQPPVFEDKERARFEGLAWMPAHDGHGAWMASLTLPLR